MNVGPHGIELIKRFEGCKSRPYRCPAFLWTVGYGKLMYPEQARLKVPDRMAFPLRPEDNRTFRPEEIDAFLVEELESTGRGVARLCPAAVDDQGQFDALVSFAFNCGLGALQRSSLRAAFNRGEIDVAADAFLKYTKAAGRELPGLVKRRHSERALFLSSSQASQ